MTDPQRERPFSASVHSPARREPSTRAASAPSRRASGACARVPREGSGRSSRSGSQASDVSAFWLPFDLLDAMRSIGSIRSLNPAGPLLYRRRAVLTRLRRIDGRGRIRADAPDSPDRRGGGEGPRRVEVDVLQAGPERAARAARRQARRVSPLVARGTRGVGTGRMPTSAGVDRPADRVMSNRRRR